MPSTANSHLEEYNAELHTLAIKLDKLLGRNRRCVNCLQFDQRDETCELAPITIPLSERRPPARIIAAGCPSWQEDIPF